MNATTLFGYRHVQGVPPCPCSDPGTYMMLEQIADDPLACRFRCWCGRTLGVTFDDLDERAAFILKHETRDERRRRTAKSEQ